MKPPHAAITNFSRKRSLLLAIAVSFLFYIPCAFAAGSISGKVTLQGHTTNHSNLITFKLKDPRSGTLSTRQVSTATDGSYSIAGIAPGTYNLSAKASNYLSYNQVLIEVIDAQDAPGIDFNLLGGDCDGNNGVSMRDFSILCAAYGTRTGQPRWDTRADFNGNGQIDMQDFTVLRINYGKLGFEPNIFIISPADNKLTNSPTTYLLGIINDATAQVSVNGLPVSVSNRTFFAPNITLTEGPNKLTALAVNKYGIKNADLVVVVLDTTAPVIAITSPQDGYISTTQTITVSGTIDDNQAAVTVNGNPAGVSDGAFSCPDITLTEGQNTITVVATDLAGNTSSNSITITYQPIIIPPITPIVIDDGQYTTTPNQLHGFWVSDDPDNVIVEVQYSIGTAPGIADVITWTSAGTATEATATGLFLNHGQAYYFNVKSKDSLSVWSDIGSSDGIIVNAHIPVINSITPQDNSTFPTKTEVTINVDAQDADGDSLEYRFLVDDKIEQDWGVSSSYVWTAAPTTKLIRAITCQVKDDKKGEVSQTINYNVEIEASDTTPPTTPQVYTDEHSNSLTELHAWWSAEDPESSIAEYQYAIGTFPGGTDVVDWTSAGTETEITHYGLNLIEGQKYYFIVRAKNWFDLLSMFGYSPANEADKEVILRITSPQDNALITDSEFPIRGIAKGTNQISINGKPVAVNPDGTFTGPTLVAPGYAKKEGITSDNSHIIMNFPGPTEITASASGQSHSITVYCYQLFIKNDYVERRDVTAPNVSCMLSNYFVQYQSWNNDLLVQPPFADWGSPDKDTRVQKDFDYAYYPWTYSDLRKYYGDGSAWGSLKKILYWGDFGGAGAFPPTTVEITNISQMTIRTPPAIDGKILPIVLIFENCYFGQYYFSLPTMPITFFDLFTNFDLSKYEVNDQPLNILYGKWDEYPTCYAILTDYQPDSDMELQIKMPIYEDRNYSLYEDYSLEYFVSGIDLLRMDLIIDGMSEKDEENEGAEIRINANYDEHDGDTKQLEDFRYEGIVAADFNLLSGQLDITGGDLKGKFELIYPQDKIIVWKENDSNNFSKIDSQVFYSVTLPVHYNLRIEAIDGSKITNDVRIFAYFIPDGSSAPPPNDRVYLTSIKTQFMLTFDDGPFANKTMNVVNDLADFYVNGQKVKAAFFMVGADGSKHSLIDFYWEGIEGVDNNLTIPAQVDNAGHYVCNHTQHHYAFWDDTPQGTVEEEIRQCNAIIQTALGGKEPPKFFRPPYWRNPSTMYKGVTAFDPNFFIVWGTSGFGDLGSHSSQWKKIAEHTADYLKEKWNTKKEPNKKDKPAIICYHEYHDGVWMHIKDIVKYLQDNGYALEIFGKDKCDSDKDYYPKSPWYYQF